MEAENHRINEIGVKFYRHITAMKRKILAGDDCFGHVMLNFKWVPRVASWNEFAAAFRAERQSSGRSRWLIDAAFISGSNRANDLRTKN